MSTRISDVLVTVNHVSKVFGQDKRATVAVSDASFALRPGECIMLLGPSGSGKTTLLSMAAGLTPVSDGSVELFGQPVANYRRRQMQRLRATHIGFVFQAYRLLDPLSVRDNVAIAAEFAGMSPVEARQRAMHILIDLQISHLGDSHPPLLSQGEKQRVAVARALVNRPELLIADEPTASLESGQALLLVKLLLAYVHERQAGLLIATHDVRLVDYADRILRIEDGRLREITEHRRSVKAG